ncbi:ABC transporter substrate-binding protein, partial [Falsiroseomonas oryzae]|uniref:ABC transporter substrate-binding protein n=1 Tax=Falsiroseomonas oryzae TaxID=2766473 RepID=UPI0022EB832F
MLTLRQIHFVPPAPFVWAQGLDAFARFGVQVEAVQTASSDEIGQGLADGRHDVGIGVADNAIGWSVERGADLVIAAQLEARMAMRFCAAPRFATLAEAAAEPIAVDATTNGFVLVLYRALARAGIARDACRFDMVGGVRQRFEALMEGRATSSILVPPFDAMAEARGFRVLWDVTELAPDYPGVVVVTARAPAREEALLRYLAALRFANDWAADAAHAAEAAAALVAARYSEAAAARLV